MRGGAQLGLDGALIGRVQRRSGFVKNHHRRVFEQGAGNRHALLLAARELEAALTHHGGVALGRGADEVMNARSAGGFFDLLAAGAGLAVGDVVFHRVIEQHRVLRHDANGLAHTGLGHLLDVLPGDGDAPAFLRIADIVKTVKQPRQRGLARTRRADHRHGLARRNFKAQLMQYGPAGLISKADVFKAHRGVVFEVAGHTGSTHMLSHHQWQSARHIGDLALFFHQVEHLVQVGQALLDLTVDHAQKAQRNVKLDHEGVDHHQVAQRHAAVDHALGGTPEHGHQTDRDDQLLAGVEQAQGALALDGGAPVALEVFVVTPCFKGLVVEVLDGFVVQQRVDGAAVRRRVQLVHLLSELRAPFGHGHREGDVENQRNDGDAGKPDVEFDGQQAEHQRDLDQRGNDAVERIGDERMHAARAALDVARHAAGLAFQVKAQAQRMQVFKDFQRNTARRALGGLGKHQLAQLGEQRGGQAQQAIGQQQRHRHHQHGLHVAGLETHGVDQVFEQQRHADIGHLGAHHESQRCDNAPLVGPEVRKKPLERVHVRARRSGLLAGRSFGRQSQTIWGCSRAHEGQS